MSTSTCTECGTSNTNFKYGGENIDCLGVKTCDSLESVIQKLSEYVCNIPTSCECTQEYIYLERDLGFGNPSVDVLYDGSGAGLLLIDDITYTVPVGKQGTYEVMFNCEALIANETYVTTQIYINDTPYSTTRNIQQADYAGDVTSVVPLTLFVSDIALVPGDKLEIRGLSSFAETFLQNATFKLTKLG